MKERLKNVLVATDFSESGNNIVNAAVELCKRFHAVMHLIHVKESRYILDNPEQDRVVSEIVNEIDHQARNRLYEVYESILREGDIAVQIHMPTGIPFDEICRYAAEMPIDLILIGRNGTSGVKSEYIGSTAYNVLKYAVKPVLLIPSGIGVPGFKNILFPIRAGQAVGRKYELLKSILANQNCHVHIGVFNLPWQDGRIIGGNNELEKIISMMKKDGLSSTREFYTGVNLAQMVVELSNAVSADLVVINCVLDYKHTQFCIGAYSREIITNSKISILSVRNCMDIAGQTDEDMINKDDNRGKLVVQGY